MKHASVLRKSTVPAASKLKQNCCPVVMKHAFALRINHVIFIAITLRHSAVPQTFDCSQAMKHAFALRMNLGDPGPDPGNPFVNVTKQDALLDDILSRKYADGLRWVPGIRGFKGL